jgi:hypothetical protein
LLPGADEYIDNVVDSAYKCYYSEIRNTEVSAMKTVTIVPMLFLLSTTAVYASHPLITDDAGTMGQGNAQLEVNGEYDHDEEAGATGTVYELAPTLTYGLTESADLVLTVPYQSIKEQEAGVSVTESGMADLAVELKWNFYNRGNLGLALKPGLTLATGDEDKGLGAGKAGYGSMLIGSLDLASFMVHANLGYFRNENESGDRKNLWHASLASECEVSEELTAVANIGLETNPDRRSATPPVFLLGGLIYSATDQISLDGGVKFGLNKPEVDYAILAGMTLAF